MDDKKVIIFDMDGVIIDSIDLMFSLNQQRFPGSGRKEFDYLFIHNIHEQLAKLKDAYQKDRLSIKQERELRDEYTKNKTEHVQLYPGIFDLLDSLSNHCHLSINTSASDKNTFKILERLSIKDLFDKILTRDVTESKVEKFEILSEFYNVQAEDFLFITDSLGDVIESSALDIPTIVVSYGVHSRGYFDTNTYHNIIDIVDSVDELKEAIDQYMEIKK